MIYINSFFILANTLVGLYFWTSNRPLAVFNFFATAINIVAVAGRFI